MNNHIQQHIETMSEALAKSTPDWFYNGNEIVSTIDPSVGIGGFLEEDDNILAANSRIWLQQSIEMLEQQQREIADKDREIERLVSKSKSIAEQKDKIIKSLASQLAAKNGLDEPPLTDYKKQYEALIQSIKDGLGEFPPDKSAEDLIGWIESTCPFVGDLMEYPEEETEQ